MIISDKDPLYRQCSISLMDNIADPLITFDENGISNYYAEYKIGEERDTLTGEKATKKIEEIVKQIKKDGIGKKYDCIIGVSGGIDSTYLCYKAKEYGLRVLCVHFDNGWNSQDAVNNIENILKKLGFELYTYVIDWPEFKDIQLAYFKAGVIDIEAITDIAIFNSLDMICAEQKIGYILDGRNIWTETTLPRKWTNKDPNNLYAIHKKFGTIPLKKYPATFKNGKFVKPAGSYTSIALLNDLDYNKSKVKEIIKKELDWSDYGGKHYESVFTRFYQGHILPEKFHVDKRKAHLSNLIFSGQLTKEQAIEEIKKPIYPKGMLEIDKTFVLKKLGFSDLEFSEYLAKEAVPHEYYNPKPKVYIPNKIQKVRSVLGKIKRKIING
ncbi:MAG: N-acetyl sugar amidotransferase [Bacteroidota bacterium]